MEWLRVLELMAQLVFTLVLEGLIVGNITKPFFKRIFQFQLQFCWTCSKLIQGFVFINLNKVYLFCHLKLNCIDLKVIHLKLNLSSLSSLNFLSNSYLSCVDFILFKLSKLKSKSFHWCLLNLKKGSFAYDMLILNLYHLISPQFK